MPLEVMWPLTRAWYRDRLDPDYEPKPLAAVQAMLEDVGLTGDFWEVS